MKKVLLFLVFSFYIFVFPFTVSAHVLQTDGSIGAVMHIDPDDDPIAGAPASFYFEFKDTKNKFVPKNCACTFSILEAGKEIYSQSLFANNSNPSLDNASATFTFSQKDVYKIVVSGKPTDQSFAPFSLSYDIRVDRVASQAQTSGTHFVLLLFSAVGLCIGCIIGTLLIIKRRKHA